MASPFQLHQDIEELVLSEEQINKKVVELAQVCFITTTFSSFCFIYVRYVAFVFPIRFLSFPGDRFRLRWERTDGSCNIERRFYFLLWYVLCHFHIYFCSYI